MPWEWPVKLPNGWISKNVIVFQRFNKIKTSTAQRMGQSKVWLARKMKVAE